VLGVPCLTLRPNTERPVTVTQGTNTVIGTDPETIVEAALGTLEADVGAVGPLPELWDGKAAERIAEILETRWGG
jgi:UDP-N-acetylglucosamine 2-epimerase (non-hydrolysing)